MYACKSAEAARLTGLLLLEAKSRVGHSKWLRFVREHYAFSVRSAQGYMRLSRLNADASLAHLGIEGLLRLFAEPKELESTPPERQRLLHPVVTTEQPPPPTRHEIDVTPAPLLPRYVPPGAGRNEEKTRDEQVRAAVRLLAGERARRGKVWQAPEQRGLQDLRVALEVLKRMIRELSG